MKRLGIDIGASSCQFVLLDENNTVLWKKSFLHHNKVRDYILTTLGEIPGLTKDESVLLSVCGTMSHLTGLSSEYTASESLALSQAVSEYYPGIGSCIMIGAQNTLYMEPEDGKEPKIRRNSNCSAGTGSFFEEQAGRLGSKSFYTDMDKLFASARGKLDFCVGGMARYRFAKLLSASAPAFDGVLMVQSNEENAGIIGKTLADEYDEEI